MTWNSRALEIVEEHPIAINLWLSRPCEVVMLLRPVFSRLLKIVSESNVYSNLILLFYQVSSKESTLSRCRQSNFGYYQEKYTYICIYVYVYIYHIARCLFIGKCKDTNKQSKLSDLVLYLLRNCFPFIHFYNFYSTL